MSLYDDITMGLGFRKPDDAYRERTAATIENNQGAAAADRVPRPRCKRSLFRKMWQMRISSMRTA